MFFAVLSYMLCMFEFTHQWKTIMSTHVIIFYRNLWKAQACVTFQGGKFSLGCLLCKAHFCFIHFIYHRRLLIKHFTIFPNKIHEIVKHAQEIYTFIYFIHITILKWISIRLYSLSYHNWITHMCFAVHYITIYNMFAYLPRVSG